LIGEDTPEADALTPDDSILPFKELDASEVSINLTRIQSSGNYDTVSSKDMEDDDCQQAFKKTRHETASLTSCATNSTSPIVIESTYRMVYYNDKIRTI
jgi:hypothetical protein